MMDSRMRQSLDHYIVFGHSYTDKVWHKCPQCNFKREIGMLYELGGWFYYPTTEEDKVECPDCHIEMEIID